MYRCRDNVSISQVRCRSDIRLNCNHSARYDSPMTHTRGMSKLSLHVLSISDFEPHPKACTIGGVKGVMQDLTSWLSNSISLTLQASDGSGGDTRLASDAGSSMAIADL